MRSIAQIYNNRYLLVLLWMVATSVQADITITQLANEGAMISDGQRKVIVDGFVVEPYAVYGGLSGEAEQAYATVSGVFSGVDLALASHRHHDHIQPDFACRFLEKSKNTTLISSPQVMVLVRERCRRYSVNREQMKEILPVRGVPEYIEQPGIKVTVFLLSHGIGKYASLQNFGHVIEMGGIKVLHVGDAATRPADYVIAGLQNMDIDVALLPYWYFLPGPGQLILEQYVKADHILAVHIPPKEMEEIAPLIAEQYPDVLIPAGPMETYTFSPESE